MNILVVDVAAEGGGALSILCEFYDKFKKDNKNTYFVATSVVKLEDTSNIKNLRFPWVKKSWLHRLWFDNFYAFYLIKKCNIDRIISLQNVLIFAPGKKQILYLHQPLPFTEIRFSFRKNSLFWIYQNIISKIIFYAVRHAQQVIVQTNWMKKAVISRCKVPEDKIVIMSPQINKNSVPLYKNHNNTFFYPSSALEYKNHKLIIEAVDLLAFKEIDFKVIFTIEESELNPKNRALCLKNYHKYCFLGKIPREEVLNYYSKSILLFPSYIETFGLPLLEASQSGTPVLASDCAFSKEILSDYGKVHFFSPFDAAQLAALMENYLKSGELYE